MKTDAPPPGGHVEHILVADDEILVKEMFHACIRKAGYRCTAVNQAAEAMEILRREPVDVVITDTRLMDLSGLELTRRIRAAYDTDVIIMTRQVKNFSYDKIIELGARDFINKPVRLTELMARLKRVLGERALRRQLDRAFTALERAYIDTVNRLSMAAEYKDEEPYDHIIRMGKYSAMLAEKAGVSRELVKIIRYASPMHDVGKIGIPDRILLKQGKLTGPEFEVMKTHTLIGARLLGNSDSHILEMASVIAASHHERWDGGGYPAGLEGESIPLPARIAAITDTFDALTSRRPYRSPYPLDAAMDILRKEREGHFDPTLTDLFLGSMDDITRIREMAAGRTAPDLFFDISREPVMTPETGTI